ncbi:hypothetical protein GQX74_002350 [Glossina fuscipes]|nr:hypothetical protein GQX74_002350 [Glossina fuscipes]
MWWNQKSEEQKITSAECVLFSSAKTWKGTFRKIRLNINNRNSDDDEVDHSTNQILIELCTRTNLKLKSTGKMYFIIEGPPTYVGPSPLNYLLLTLLEKLKTQDCHGKAVIFKYQITVELSERLSEPYTDSRNVTNEKIDATYLHELVVKLKNDLNFELWFMVYVLNELKLINFGINCSQRTSIK